MIVSGSCIPSDPKTVVPVRGHARRSTLRAALIPVVLLVLSAAPHAQEPPAPGEKLTLEQCIDRALRYHPDLMVYREAVVASEARVKQAKSSFYPTLDAAAAARRDQAVTVHEWTASGAPASGLPDGNHYGADLSLNLMVYDFGRRSNEYAAEQKAALAATNQFDSAAIALRHTVTLAYYGVLTAQRARDAVAESVKKYEEHLKVAEAYFEAGTRPRYDVTKAEVDLSNEQLNLIKVENRVRLAWVDLNRAMGLESDTPYAIEDDLSYEHFGLPLEEALQTAYRDRPDLQALQAQLEQAEHILASTSRTQWPVLSVGGGYTFAARELPFDQGWNVGVKVSANLFDGFLTRGRTLEAAANRNAARAAIESLRLHVGSEIHVAYSNLQQAEESISNAEVQVKLAKETLELASLRYEAGVGSVVEVTDAMVLLRDAELSRIFALSEYRVAQAGIERAMGIKTGSTP